MNLICVVPEEMSAMRPIDSLGFFWFHDAEEDHLAGHLTFDPTEGGRLELLLDDYPHSASRSIEQERFVYGVIDTGAVTINNYFQGPESFISSGVARSTIVINSMMLGAHIRPDELQFKNAYVHTSVGGDWVGREIDTYLSLGIDTAEIFEFDRGRPEDLSANFSRGEISLRYVWETSGVGSTKAFSIEHWPVFRLVYEDLTSLDIIHDDTGRISDLVTLCSDEISTAKSLSFSRPDVRMRMLSGDEGPAQEISFLAQQIGYSRSVDRKDRYKYQMLLTFDEAGGIETVARWLDRCPSFARALNSMMSVRRADRIYAENRFLNVAFAAEAFHRDVYGGTTMSESEFTEVLTSCLEAVSEHRREWLEQKLQHSNSLNFRKRIQNLAERAGELFDLPAEDRREWVNSITVARNDLTHLDSTKANFDGGALYFLSESLYSVVRTCMLLEVGVPGATLVENSKRLSSARYRARLSESVAYVKECAKQARSRAAIAEELQ